MSRATPANPCPRSDAVLARFLDGDVGEDSGFELVCDDMLRAHLRDCAICQRQLLRARRLDAALAAQAGAAVGAALEPLAQRWFAAVTEATRSGMGPSGAGRTGAGPSGAGQSSAALGDRAATATRADAAGPGPQPQIAAGIGAAPRAAASIRPLRSLRRTPRPLRLAACVAVVLAGVSFGGELLGGGQTQTDAAAGDSTPHGTMDASVATARTRVDGAATSESARSGSPPSASLAMATAPAAIPTTTSFATPPTAPRTPLGTTAACDDTIRIAADAVRRQAQRPRTERPATPDASSLWRCVGDPRRPVAERESALAQLESLPRSLGWVAAEPFVALAGLGDATAAERALHARALATLRTDPAVDTQLPARLRRLVAGGGDSGFGDSGFDHSGFGDSGFSDSGFEEHAAGRAGGADIGPAPDDLTIADLARITVAARLGSAAVDEALLDLVRRRPACAGIVAAALRCGVRDEGAAHLLLDAWCGLTARGILDADDTTPMAWFTQQPAALFTAVAAELTTTRSAPRRVHCLLALGHATDGASLRLLVEHVVSAPFLEAHAAAFALSHRPRAQLAACLAALRTADRTRPRRADGLPDLELLAATAAAGEAPAAAGRPDPGPRFVDEAAVGDAQATPSAALRGIGVLRSHSARSDAHLLLLAALARAGMADAADWADPTTLRALQYGPFAAFLRLAGKLRDRTPSFRE